MSKQKAMYEIRSFADSKSYSKPMSPKLRTRYAAKALVKRLRIIGHDAFSVKIMVSA